MRRRSRVSTAALHAAALLCLSIVAVPGAQAPEGRPPAVADDIGARIRALEREGEALADRASSLLGELRALERERDGRTREAAEAEAAVAAAQQALQESNDRLSALEQARVAQLPDLRTQLVDIYKQGRGRHARILVEAGSLRAFARARRAAAALVAITQERLTDHRRLLDTFRQEHAALEATARAVQARDEEAQQARAAAQRALDAHRSLVARIESERDLNAQYVSELQTVYQRLHDEVAARPAAPGGDLAARRPIQGRLQWPVVGSVVGRYGEAEGRLGGTAVRNGIELAAPLGTPVAAAYPGTVSYAGAYTGFGTLVVLDHGNAAYSLYGYLGAVSAALGDRVDAGSPVGRVGLAPAGSPALYFELRIDGQPVDPVQWFEPRQLRP